ncbi:MAG: hypothetical protein R2851_22555 [Caldilineaceae bacterium]
MAERIFLKLGGSLITDKRAPETPRLDVIHRLAAEIAAARPKYPACNWSSGTARAASAT